MSNEPVTFEPALRDIAHEVRRLLQRVREAGRARDRRPAQDAA